MPYDNDNLEKRFGVEGRASELPDSVHSESVRAKDSATRTYGKTRVFSVHVGELSYPCGWSSGASSLRALRNGLRRDRPYRLDS